jgi:hypothetical protein
MSLRITFITAGRILRQLLNDRRTVVMILAGPALIIALISAIMDAAPHVFNTVGLILLAVFPFFMMFLVTSITLLRERTGGTLERLMTTPTAKIDLVRSLGADHVIDYTRTDFLDGATRYDVIIDTGGRNRLPRLRRALAPTGTLVIVGGDGGGKVTGGFGRGIRAAMLSPLVRQRLVMLVNTEHHRYLDQLRPLIEAGAVTPALDTTYPLAQAAAAMRHLEAGNARGKIAITI